MNYKKHTLLNASDRPGIHIYKDGTIIIYDEAKCSVKLPPEVAVNLRNCLQDRLQRRIDAPDLETNGYDYEDIPQSTWERLLEYEEKRKNGTLELVSAEPIIRRYEVERLVCNFVRAAGSVWREELDCLIGPAMSKEELGNAITYLSEHEYIAEDDEGKFITIEDFDLECDILDHLERNKRGVD